MDAPIEYQSGVASNTQEVVTFIDTPDTQHESVGTHNVHSRINDSNIGLAQFFARPIKIATYPWGSVNFQAAFDPWELYLSNKRVVNKMATYKLFKGTCHVRFVINGNKFFYGRLMACYLPLANFDALTQFRPGFVQDNIMMSQLPKVMLCPCASDGGEMTLPFMWHYDYLDLTLDQSTDLGTIVIRELNPLRNASSVITGVNPVTIAVYAWLTDVELCSPTHTNPSNIVSQSGREESQAPSKPISQGATIVAKISTVLSTIPMLAPFTMPLAKAATMASAVASILGYSRPTLVEEPSLFTPRITDSLATTNTTSDVNKLTLDAKQGLSISPSDFGGRTEDEMSFAYMKQVESYWFTTTWDFTLGAGARLVDFLVHPQALQTLGAPGGNQEVHMSALAGMSLPFDYWTGSITYRIEVVSSGFHRGRLAVVYDADRSPLNLEENVVYTDVIDIAETKEYSITVSNHQAQAWLSRGARATRNQVLFSTNEAVPIDGVHNGVISLWVINELTVPNYDPAVDQDVEINVYIKGGPDFSVSKPGLLSTGAVIAHQSGKEVTPDPVPTSTAAITTPIPSHDNRMYIGEEIGSLRALVKRYTLYRRIGGYSSAKYPNVQHPMYPLFRGAMSNAVDTASTGTYNYVENGYINYYRPAFQCIRGGVRWKYIPKIGWDSASYTRLKVTRIVSNAYISKEDPELTPLNTSAAAREMMPEEGLEGANGSAITVMELNPGLSWECPFYSNYKFGPCKIQNVNNPGNVYDGFRINFPRVEHGVTSGDLFVSAAEDFSLSFFTGWPRMFFEDNPPALP